MVLTICALRDSHTYLIEIDLGAEIITSRQFLQSIGIIKVEEQRQLSKPAISCYIFRDGNM